MGNADKYITDNINKINVGLSMSWGTATFNDYELTVKKPSSTDPTVADGTMKRKVDFQDLMVAVSEYRAVTVEDEVVPLTTRIKARNKYLDQLGVALAAATKKQSEFASDAEGSKVMSGWFDADTTATMVKAGCSTYFNATTTSDGKTTANATKAGIEGIIQVLKSTIDGLNNRARADMTRLQGLVDRRDESYSTASNLMSSISDTRSNTIRNM